MLSPSRSVDHKDAPSNFDSLPSLPNPSPTSTASDPERNKQSSGLAKFRDKILNLKSQIQEDIHELSSEDES